ncbi:MAG: SycD/LcrH family type III secretion system chaperone, partial [Desulfobacterales bacterium]|nr:SycD/LcrH family type III secretion system chaperone [Desulfobacterales bacterium]
EFIKKGASFKDLRGLTDKDMEAIYSLGYTAYNNGKFEDAMKVFKFLSFYDHMQKKYWMGLAGCRQMLKDYAGAVQAYAYIAILDVSDPKVHLHAADCLMALKSYKEAESALLAAVHWAGDQSGYADVKNRALAVLQVLKRTETEEKKNA